jgi:hypothetical protein
MSATEATPPATEPAEPPKAKEETEQLRLPMSAINEHIAQFTKHKEQIDAIMAIKGKNILDDKELFELFVYSTQKMYSQTMKMFKENNMINPDGTIKGTSKES